MATKSTHLNLTTFSVKVYRLLLKAYPTKFQREYGSQMVLVFQDCCIRALRQGGMNGMVKLWAVTLLDLIQSVISERTQKETDMSKSKFIKWSGWAFILGSFSFITILSTSIPVQFAGSVITSVLLAVGMIGLRARYGERAGGFGRNILTASVIGMILFYLVVALLVLAVLVMLGIRSPQAESLAQSGLWLLPFGGPVVGLLGLTLFGLAALRSKPTSQLNGLPVIAGVWYPLTYLFLAAYLYTHDGVYPHDYHNGMQMMFLMQFVALCVFGAVVAADTPQEMATA